MDDTISRREAVSGISDLLMLELKGERLPTYNEVYRAIYGLPSAQPEITYQTCSDALLKMWMDNVLTDGEYNRIMDKLNAHWGEGEEHGTSRTVLSQKPMR